MFNAIVDWWQFNFWLSLACLAAGVTVISPFLLSKTFRRRLCKVDLDVETIGFVALILAVLIIGLYNRFGAAGSGA